MRKLIAISLLLLSCAGHAQAQSVCPQTTIQGYVLTPGQWSACWSAKQDALGYSPVNRNGDTMNGRLVAAAPGTATAGFNMTPGSAPSSPANGDVWPTSAGLFVRVGGSTIQIAASGTPALSSCGTSPAIAGTDFSGTVTMGTSTPTGCTITFATAKGAAPHCAVTWRSVLAAMSYSVSTAAITLTQTATSSNVVDYVCNGG